MPSHTYVVCIGFVTSTTPAAADAIAAAAAAACPHRHDVITAPTPRAALHRYNQVHNRPVQPVTS